MTLGNSPCSRMALAPCGKDVAVGVSSSSRLVCGSDRPSQDFAGPFFSPWLPLPALCHAPWRPWDLGNMREQLSPVNWPLSKGCTLSSRVSVLTHSVSACGKCKARWIAVVMDEEKRDLHRYPSVWVCVWARLSPPGALVHQAVLSTADARSCSEKVKPPCLMSLPLAVVMITNTAQPQTVPRRILPRRLIRD